MKLAFALILAAFPAFADPQCAGHDDIKTQLAVKYGEGLRSIGLTPGGQMVETYASPDTGTWTIVVTMANGLSCILSSGGAYQEAKAGVDG